MVEKYGAALPTLISSLQIVKRGNMQYFQVVMFCRQVHGDTQT